MKRVILAMLGAALFCHLPAEVHAQQQQIDCSTSTPCNVSSGPSNTGNGDPLWKVGGKINANEQQLFDMFGNSSHLATNGTAIYSDITSLWTGAGCNVTTNAPLLNGNCFTPSSGGSSSVSLSPPGGTVFSVTGSPGASLGLVVSGTSGGVPYFSSSSAIGSSGILTLDQIMLGGGPGNPPIPLGTLGTTTTVLHGNASGLPSFAQINLATDVAGVLPSANGGTNQANSGTYTDNGLNQTLGGTGSLQWNMSGTTNPTLMSGSYTVGYLGLPPCTAASNSAASACPLTAGTSFLLPANSQWIIINCGSACTQTIPANAAVPYPIGSCLIFLAEPGSSVVTVAITSDSMSLIGAGTTGSRTLTPTSSAPAGMAACKYQSTGWVAIPQGGVTMNLPQPRDAWGAAANDEAYEVRDVA
jgi:hypothetical protein